MPPIPEDKKRQLQNLIEVMGTCGAPKEILNARIKKIVAGMGLPKDAIPEVKKAFTAGGFKVLNVAAGQSAVSLLPPPSMTTAFEKWRDQLIQYMNTDKGKLDPQCQIMQKITDIYDFLAAYNGQLDTAETFRNSLKDATQQKLLYARYDKVIEECSGSRASAYPYRFYLEMAQAAQSLLGEQGDGALKYARYLKLEHIKLKYPFLTKLEEIPVTIKQEKWFADECISKLQQAFGEDEAYAFYNFLARMTEEPYEKESTSVNVVCPECGKVHEFSDLSVAHKAVCSCGVPLYRQCPSCKKLWPASMDYCGDSTCGFNLNAVRFFAVHYQNAENALRASDPVTARTEFNAAQLCNPMETVKLKALDGRIVELEERLGKPIRELNALIAAKQLNAANARIGVISRTLPGVDLSSFIATIKGELDWARKQMAQLATLRQESDIVRVCLNVLNRVADDSVAEEELRRHAPLPVRSISVIPNLRDCSCTIRWESNPQNVGVSYTVVRKQGRSAPANVCDGEVVTENCTTFDVKDNALKPGVEYCYAVFAVRAGLESSAVATTEPILFLQKPDMVEVNSVDEKCVLSWRAPAGCVGVRIVRDRKIIAQCVTTSSYVDENVADGDEYTYELQTVWKVGGMNRYSGIVTKEVTVEAVPEAIELSGKQEGGVCQINWNRVAHNKNVMLVQMAPGRTVEKNDTIPASQLQKMGKVLYSVPAQLGKFHFQFPANTHMYIAAFVSFGDSVIASNMVSVSSITGCQIDEQRTCIENKRLVTVLKRIPEGATRLAYSVRTDRFATYEEAPYLPSVPCNNVHMISGGSTGNDLYVSIFAIFENKGGRVFSAPANYKVLAKGKSGIKYRIHWNKGWSKMTKLEVTVDGDRPVPGLTLHGSLSGKPIIGNFNSDLIVLARIEPQAESSCSVVVNAEQLKRLPKKTRLRLDLDEKYAGEYNLPEPTHNSNITP